jgi:hypothetical protein
VIYKLNNCLLQNGFAAGSAGGKQINYRQNRLKIRKTA